MKISLILKVVLMIIITLVSFSAANALDANVLHSTGNGGYEIPAYQLDSALELSFVDHFAIQSSRERVVQNEEQIKILIKGVKNAVLLPASENAPLSYKYILTINEYYPIFDKDYRREAKKGFKKERIYSHVRNDAVSYNLYIQSLNNEIITARLSDSADILSGEIYAGAIQDKVLNENSFVSHLFFKIEGQSSTQAQPPAEAQPQPIPAPIPIPSSVFGIFVENRDENGVYSSDFLIADNGGSISDAMLGEIGLTTEDTFYTQPSRKHVVQYAKSNKFYINGVKNAVILKSSEPAPDGYEKVVTFNDTYPVFDRDSKRRWLQNGARKEQVYEYERNDAISYTLYINPLNGEKFESKLLDNRDSAQALINESWVYAGRITDRILNENNWDKHLFVRTVSQGQSGGTTPAGNGTGSSETPGSSGSGSGSAGGSDSGSDSGTATIGSGSAGNSDTISAGSGSGSAGGSSGTGSENAQLTNYGSDGGHGSYHRNAKKHSVIIQALSADKYSADCADELTFSVELRNNGRVREDNIEVEVANLELGLYEKSAPIILLAGRGTVEDIIIKLPKTHTSGVYNFIVKVMYNGIVAATQTETIEVGSCSLAQQKKPIQPIAVKEEFADSVIEVKLPPLVEQSPETGNSWFWPIFCVLVALIVAELVGFKAWSYYQKNQKNAKNNAKEEIEKQLNSFTEKDRFY